jgi:ankyrin repeat protein
LDLIQLFLKRPEVNVNIKDCQGVTPLLLASRLGYLFAVKLLLGHPSINLGIADKIGQTPFIAASRGKLTEIAGLLRLHAQTSRQVPPEQ